MIRKIVISDEGIFSNGKKYLWEDIETIVYEDTECERGGCCFKSTLTIIFKSKKKLEFSDHDVHNFEDLYDEIMERGNFAEDQNQWKGGYRNAGGIVQQHRVYIPRTMGKTRQYGGMQF